MDVEAEIAAEGRARTVAFVVATGEAQPLAVVTVTLPLFSEGGKCSEVGEIAYVHDETMKS